MVMRVHTFFLHSSFGLVADFCSHLSLPSIEDDSLGKTLGLKKGVQTIRQNGIGFAHLNFAVK